MVDMPSARDEHGYFDEHGEWHERPADQALTGNRPNLPAGMQPGTAVDTAMAQIVTMQNCGIKRDLASVRQRIRAEATEMGTGVYYSIPFKSRANGVETTNYIEGPSIRCAEMVARNYGNCTVQVDVKEDTKAYYFAARFIDYETGFSITRLFRQRKNQNTGMGRSDPGRAEDIVFQIGQSKAIRNAVRAGLGYICDYAVEFAREGLIKKIEGKPDDYRNRLILRFEEMDVPLLHVERVVGLPAAKWNARHMARLVAEIQSVTEGMAVAEDLWPSNAADAVALQQAQERPRTGDEAVRMDGGSDEVPGQQQGGPVSDNRPTTGGQAAGQQQPAATGKKPGPGRPKKQPDQAPLLPQQQEQLRQAAQEPAGEAPEAAGTGQPPEAEKPSQRPAAPPAQPIKPPPPPQEEPPDDIDFGS